MSWEGRVWHPTEYSWLLAQLLQLVEVSGRSILDVGCGAGNLTLAAAARGARAYASDIMPDATIETARNAAALKLPIEDVRVSDGLQYWIEQRKKFDIIICNPPCFDRLEDVTGPSADPVSNSYLIKDVLRTYQKALNDCGCLVFVVSGQKNMMWADMFLQSEYGVRAYINRRAVRVEAVADDLLERLCQTELVTRVSDRAEWDAYYFAIFHF